MKRLTLRPLPFCLLLLACGDSNSSEPDATRDVAADVGESPDALIDATDATTDGGVEDAEVGEVSDVEDVGDVLDAAADAEDSGLDALDADSGADPEIGEDVIELPDAEPDAPGDVPVREYPLDDVLRLNHVQVKGTHNSYHLEPAFAFDASHEYSHLPLDEQLGELGVRQFELDVHYDGDGFFTVFHLPVIDADTTCSTFVECLQTVRGWSDANPYHSPIFIWIEPKDDLDPQPIRGHYDELDAEIRSVFPDRLITPDMVQGDHPTLRDAAVSGDWPTLGEVRGHVVFIMLDNEVHHQSYTENRTTLAGRAMFVNTPDFAAPYAAFVKYNDPIGSGAAITSAAEQGFIVACNAGGIDNSDELVQAKVEAGLAVGAHTLGTDLPGPVGDRYWFDMPSEGVARCNPVSAPPECVDTAIE